MSITKRQKRGSGWRGKIRSGIFGTESLKGQFRTDHYVQADSNYVPDWNANCFRTQSFEQINVYASLISQLVKEPEYAPKKMCSRSL